MHSTDSQFVDQSFRRLTRIARTPAHVVPERQVRRPATVARPFSVATPEACEAAIHALTATGNFRVLRRLVPRDRYADAAGAKTHTALFIDVETTGLKQGQDRIIQFAVVPFTFTEDGRVCEVQPAETWLEDPGVPIPAEITALTGIRQGDVIGQRIDDARVASLLSEAALVIAHNAQFDRPFVERRFLGFDTLPWGCSMEEVPWIDEGLPTKKLEWLAERHAGVFYDAHRAEADCLAGVHLLASTLPSERCALAVLLDRVRQKSIRVWATGAPYAKREVLKARGYRWSGGEDGQPRAWWRDVREPELEAEREWLIQDVYTTADCPALVQRYGPKLRYSSRASSVRLESLAAPVSV